MGELFGRIHGELLHLLFLACRANEPPVIPLRRTERTDERALGAVPFLAKDADLRSSRAEGAEGGGADRRERFRVVSEIFGVWLQKRPGKQFIRGGEAGRTSGSALPKFTDHFLRARGSLGAQFTGRLRQRARGIRFHKRKKRGKSGQQNEKVQFLPQ